MPLPENPVIYLSFANNAQNNLPALPAERKTMQNWLNLQKFLEVQHEAETEKDDIFKLFSRYSGRVAVWHYGGHAGKVLLQLTDTNLKGDTLATLITEEIRANPESLALVFLNGCNTDGLVNSLLEAGVKCVIATGTKINDDTAKTFATKFYETWVGTGKGEISVRTAYQTAHAYITNEPENNHIRWTETIGSENNNDAEAWGLYQREAGIANTITLKSLAKDETIAQQGLVKINTKGDNNTILHNIQNSTVVINDTSELKALLEEIKSNFSTNTALQVFVLASTLQDYQTLPAEIPIPYMHYNDTAEGWKPYNCASILDLLLEFRESSKLVLDIIFVNRFVIPDDEWENDFKQDISSKAILILDSFSLCFKENIAFAELFNRCSVGGFLVPLAQYLLPEQKEFCNTKLESFKDVRISWQSKFNKPYMFIDLDIPRKSLLFRRLADIAFKHLEFKGTGSKDNLDKALQQRDTKTGSHKNLG